MSNINKAAVLNPFTDLTANTLLTKASAEDGTATSANTISAQVLKEAIQYHAPTVTNIVGNAETATKLQTPRTINGVLFDGTQNISLPEAGAYSLPTASDSVLGGIKVGSGLAISNSVLSVDTLNQSTTGNAATATKLQTACTISLTGAVTGNVNFDGSGNVSITTAIGTTTVAIAQGGTGATTVAVARTNLEVYSKAETDSIAATPNATEAVAGKAKIATTVIAQAGVNDTDFITAKKLRDALNVGGRIHATLYASTVSSVTTILKSKNILSVVRTATGKHTITTASNMDDVNYTLLGLSSLQGGTTGGFILCEDFGSGSTPVRTINSFQLETINGSAYVDAWVWGVSVVC